MAWLLQINVISGPAPYVVWGLTVLIAVILLIRRPTVAWVIRVLLALLIGAIVGVGAVYLVNTTGMFGPDPLPIGVTFWTGAGMAILGFAIVSLWERGWWRKTLAAILIVLSVLSTALGVNAVFGITSTIGDIFGISTTPSIDNLPKPHPHVSPTGPIYQTWNPPADMPKQGKIGALSGANAIPSTAGFKPRDASVYLPPAALVPNAPPLPVVVWMMGFPGNPDPSFIAAALDQEAAAHKGLAPIVIVADQLGTPEQDPICADSQKYGGVATYFNTDIPAYIKKNLNVLPDHKYWTIGGYSNGGACAFTWAAQHPEIWGNMASLSGDEYPGVEWRAQAIKDIYGGNTAAFLANTPAAWLKVNQGKFGGHAAVFTVGGSDPGYIPGQKRNAALAQDAGFTTTMYIVPGAGHVRDALIGGFPKIFDVLYPVWGLAPR